MLPTHSLPATSVVLFRLEPPFPWRRDPGWPHLGDSSHQEKEWEMILPRHSLSSLNTHSPTHTPNKVGGDTYARSHIEDVNPRSVCLAMRAYLSPPHSAPLTSGYTFHPSALERAGQGCPCEPPTALFTPLDRILSSPLPSSEAWSSGQRWREGTGHTFLPLLPSPELGPCPEPWIMALSAQQKEPQSEIRRLSPVLCHGHLDGVTLGKSPPSFSFDFSVQWGWHHSRGL